MATQYRDNIIKIPYHKTGYAVIKHSEYDQEIPQSQRKTTPWHKPYTPIAGICTGHCHISFS